MIRVLLVAAMASLAASCNIIKPPPASPPLRATTVYILGGTLGSASLPGYLRANLPAVKDIGFDSVYLPAIWADFDPAPFSSPYNAVAFNNARAALSEVRAAGMRALIGLNYVGVGFAPDFGSELPPDQACNWAVTPPVYAKFEKYATQVMLEYQAFHDITQLMVFTESAEGCGLATPQAAPQVALQLQTTLGSLPSRIPPTMRKIWRWGYHDYSIVNLGWGNGVGPIKLPNQFDFVSMVAYNVSDVAELDARAGRFAALYPGSPLLVGESGANGCPGASPPQATVDSIIVSWALQHRYGVNVWGWPNAGEAECTNPVYGGYAITNVDGTPNATAAALRLILPH